MSNIREVQQKNEYAWKKNVCKLYVLKSGIIILSIV